MITWHKNGSIIVVKEQQRQVQNGSAQCGAMLPTLSYSLTHHSLLIWVWSSIAPVRPTPVITQQVTCPRRSSGPIHQLQCNGNTCSTSLLSSSSGRGKASRWTRWGEGNVSSYRVLTAFLCALCLKNHFLFIALFNVTLLGRRLSGALEGWTFGELMGAALTADSQHSDNSTKVFHLNNFTQVFILNDSS